MMLPGGSRASLMFQRCSSRQSNFGVENLTGGILMGTRLLTPQDANRNGSCLAAAVEHRDKRPADNLAAKEYFVMGKNGRIADCVKPCQRRVALVDDTCCIDDH